jgi:hypothetical protein
MSVLKVKVLDTEISHREGVATKSGKPYSIDSQENIYIELNNEVRRLPINLPKGASAYAPGNYTIDLTKLVTVGRFGLEMVPFAEIKLIPASGNVANMNMKAG